MFLGKVVKLSSSQELLGNVVICQKLAVELCTMWSSNKNSAGVITQTKTEKTTLCCSAYVVNSAA